MPLIFHIGNRGKGNRGTDKNDPPLSCGRDAHAPFYCCPQRSAGILPAGAGTAPPPYPLGTPTPGRRLVRRRPREGGSLGAGGSSSALMTESSPVHFKPEQLLAALLAASAQARTPMRPGDPLWHRRHLYAQPSCPSQQVNETQPFTASQFSNHIRIVNTQEIW